MITKLYNKKKEVKREREKKYSCNEVNEFYISSIWRSLFD